MDNHYRVTGSSPTEASEPHVVTWPSGPVSLPAVPRFQVEVVGSEAFGTWFWLTHGLDDVELPVDFYLREPVETAANDLNGLLALVRDWGRFSDSAFRDVIEAAPENRVVRDGERNGWLPRGNASIHARRWMLGEHLGLNTLESRSLVHPSEVALRVRRLQQFAQHLDAWQSKRSVEDAWPGADASGWVMLRDHLNQALSPFQIRMDLLGEPASRVDVPVTAFSVAALQLWNDLEIGSYRYCDECGRLFTRQRGRAAGNNGVRTTGVRFHDRTCATRYTVREHRRRRRMENQ